MSEVEKQPESTAPEQKAAPAGAAAAAPVAEKAARSGKKLSTKIRLIVELAALVLALVVICIVGEVKNLKWWCYMRASLGSAEMQYKLGENCANENPKEAAEWFRKAAAQGHPKAAHRLVETTLPITAIAKEVHFSNLTAFHRKFRETFGVSPNTFRKDPERRKKEIPDPAGGGPKRPRKQLQEK